MKKIEKKDDVRPPAYVCSLTETHVQRVEGVMAFMVACDIKRERAASARTISLILRNKRARRSIGPKAKKSECGFCGRPLPCGCELADTLRRS